MSVMDKFFKMLGVQEEHEDEQVIELPEMQSIDAPHTTTLGQKTMRMVVINNRILSDAKQVVDNLKENRPVIVTLHDANPDESQRIIDFISGAIYAIEGSVEKISNSTFVFAPKNVIVDKEKCEEIVKEEVPIFIKGTNGN
jgi:cell division inhibitor SepF